MRCTLPYRLSSSICLIYCALSSSDGTFALTPVPCDIGDVSHLCCIFPTCSIARMSATSYSRSSYASCRLSSSSCLCTIDMFYSIGCKWILWFPCQEASSGVSLNRRGYVTCVSYWEMLPLIFLQLPSCTLFISFCFRLYRCYPPSRRYS